MSGVPLGSWIVEEASEEGVSVGAYGIVERRLREDGVMILDDIVACGAVGEERAELIASMHEKLRAYGLADAAYGKALASEKANVSVEFATLRRTMEDLPVSEEANVSEEFATLLRTMEDLLVFARRMVKEGR